MGRKRLPGRRQLGAAGLRPACRSQCPSQITSFRTLWSSTARIIPAAVRSVRKRLRAVVRAASTSMPTTKRPHGGAQPQAERADSLLNCIERGWKFYDERPYLAGLFYWTGFDYRGEPNPMKFPATGSQFGILDYCGFPKDEAWYLKSWWTDERCCTFFPTGICKVTEGDSIDIWVYSNCDEVELTVNGKKLERKPMPRNGHLS